MPQLGLFGKMPSVGDFVSRGFSHGLCEGLDGLVQSVLVASASDGRDAREVMQQARPVMIAIRPGALCSSGFSGLWLPSQDRVGRVFPLCIGVEMDAEQAQAPLFWPSDALTLLLGSSVMRVLEAAGGPDDLLAALPTLEAWTAAATRDMPFSNSGDETVPDAAYRGSLFAIQGPERSMTAPARALCSRLPWVVQALGTIVGPDGKPAWYFGTRTLLSWTQLAAVFDGRWSHWEWKEIANPLLDETVPGLLAQRGA